MGAATPRFSLQYNKYATAAILRRYAWQALVVVLVGVALGALVPLAATLPFRSAALVFALAVTPFVLFIIGQLRRVLLISILVDVPFQFDLYLGYDQAAARYGSIVGWNVGLMTPLLALLYGLWFCEAMARQGPLAAHKPRLTWPLSAYLACVGASAIIAYSPRFTSYEFVIVAQGALLFAYIYGSVRDMADWMFLVRTLLVVYVLQCVTMLAGLLLGPHLLQVAGIAPLYINDPFIGMRRLTGSFGSPNVAGAYLSLLLTPAVALLLAARRGGDRWLGGVAAILGAACLVLTFSRGGWSGSVVALALFVVVAWRAGWLTPIFPLLGGLGVIVFALAFQNALLERLLGDDAGAAEARVPLMQIAFAMIGDHPLLGIGANNFALLLPQYVTAAFSQDWLYLVHNRYLLVWAETGTLGLLAFVSLLATTAWAGGRVSCVQLLPLAPVVAAFAATVVGQSLHMLVDIFNSRPQIQLVLVVAALIHSSTQIVAKEQACRAVRL